MASGPRSPVRTLTTVSTGTDQTLPSQMRPVCAALTTTPIRSSASSSSQRTSTRTFGTKSTWYSAPRYTSVCPRCLPYPLASVIVRPWTPNACNAALTSSSLDGTMPVTSTTSANTRAWRRPFCPVVASSTSSTSSTVVFFSTTRLTLPSSSISPTLVCNRPAVSMTTTSTPLSVPSLTASN